MLRTAEPLDPGRSADPATVPADRPAAGVHLTVQRGMFAGPTALVPQDLYAEILRGNARRERERVLLTPGSHVTTNTYWGRLHATYWQRWTAVGEVRVELHASGRGRVWLMASDTNKVARAVDVAEIDSEIDSEIDGDIAGDIAGDGATVVLTGALDRFVDGGGMWVEMATDTGELTVADVRWSVAHPEPLRPTSITICTFNRVEDCLNTLQALLDDPFARECVRYVQVVDQGTDPLQSRDRFAGIAEEFGEQLRYQRQPNLGGAGGFTRGLFEATAGDAADDHDVLLMDDDVLLDPEIVVRLIGFAACTALPTIVGGQMLNLLHPGHVHVTAEYALPEKLTVGLPVEGAICEGFLLGRDERNLPIVQERRVDTEYNGWWSCLIPAAIVRAVGYPLPLFFQWDDVEFGYRAREHGFPTVSLPGAGVWHADFGWKDWDEWHRYFNQRNGLITASLRTGFDRRTVTTTVTTLLGQYLVAMQYGLAATLLQAVEDFLDGPDILVDGSAAAAAEIRRIRAAYPETTPVPVSELPLDFRDTQVHLSSGKPTRMLLTWVKRALLQGTGRVPFRTGMVPAGEAHWWHVSLFERAIVTDMAETGVRVRTRDRNLLRELSRRAVRTLRRLHTEGPQVAQRWRDAAPQLTSRDNWARLYEVDERV